MGWIDDESIRLCSPLFADVFVGRKAFERLQSSPEIVSVDEVLKVPAQLLVIVVVEALDGRILDGAVHSLHLAVGPRMVDLGQPVLDAVVVADPIEDVMERIFVTGLVGKLDAIVGEYRVDGVGHSRHEVPQELRGNHLAGLLVQLGVGELGCPIDGDEQAQLAFGRLHLGDVDPRITSEDKHGSSRSDSS